MKLGILTQYYPPEIGAPQGRLSDLAQRFIGRGHEVFVLTAMPNYPTGRVYPGYHGLFRRERRDGASVQRTVVYPTRSVALVPRLASYLSFTASASVAGVVSLPTLDYLVTESPPLFLGMAGYFLSRIKRSRWIFNVSDLWPDSAVRLGAVRQGWGLRAAFALEAFCYRKAWLVTGQSREIVDDIRGRFPGVPTYHLSNGVDTTKFSPVMQCSGVRHELGMNGGCVAVYCGLHGIAQGLDQVLVAADRLRDVPHLELVLMGDGPEKPELMRKAKALRLDNVRFLDPCAREAMPARLASADIALIPLKSRLPGAVPSKLYEAMASGLPVVLAADGEAAGIVHESGCGIGVPPGDGHALAEALRFLAGHPEERRVMGMNGRRAAMGRYERKVIGEDFVRFLEEHL